MELDFKDCSITKFVANHKNLLIIIETDFSHKGSFQISVYKDTVASLGGEWLGTVHGMGSLIEAFKRAPGVVNNILKNLVVWVK